MSTERSKVLALAGRWDLEARLLPALASEKRTMARGAAIVAKRVPDGILAALREGITNGTIARELGGEFEKALGVTEGAKLAELAARIFYGFAEASISQRFDDLGASEVQALLDYANAADLRAALLREQAGHLRALFASDDTNPQPAPLEASTAPEEAPTA